MTTRFCGFILWAWCVLAGCTSRNAGSVAGEVPGKEYNQLATYFNQTWAKAKHWDDGLAEVAVYDAERMIYGENRTYEYAVLTVKEDFNRENNVKTDDYTRNDLFEVLKVNSFARIETDNYPYHYLTSVFILRDRPWALHKLTTSSQEWCGNTFKSITDKGANFDLSYNSYFDGQGTGGHQLPKELLVEDQLPYTLRALKFTDNPTFDANILETQQTNQAKAPVVYKAHIRSINAQLNEAEVWQVQVQLDSAKVNSYWFAKAYPNHLLQQQTWDGRNLKLKKISRYAYWKRDS